MAAGDAGVRAPETLDASELTPVARAALGDPAATVLAWRLVPLGTSLGPVTAGLYRVAGTARTAGGERPWTAVLKVVRPPLRSRHGAGLGDPQHWAYWRREPLAYTSGLLADLPGGLAAPRLLLAQEATGAAGAAAVWLWLEELIDHYGGRWPPEQFRRTAHHLGAFNGAYLFERSLPELPWLGRRYLRQRIAQAQRDGGWPRFGAPATWRHPHLRDAFERGSGERLGRLWSDRVALLDALEGLPQTLRHGDAHRSNCFAGPPGPGEGTGRTTAIDWGTLGIGPVGSEAIELALGVFAGEDLARTGRPDVAEGIFESYLAGLRAAGWGGDPRLARLGYAAPAALTGASRLHWTLERVLDDAGRAALEASFGVTAAHLMRRWGAQTRYSLHLADEARRLIVSP